MRSAASPTLTSPRPSPLDLFSPRFLVFAGFALTGWLLLRSGRLAQVGCLGRALVLLLCFFLLGGIAGLLVPALQAPLGLHPSPMCAIGRLLQVLVWKHQLAPFLALNLGVITALSLVGRKLFCGWACPLGALQELAYLVPAPLKLPALPFRFTNAVRIYFFAVFLAGLVAFEVYLYGGINAFELLHWDNDYAATTLGLGTLIAASWCYFRPYCHLVCPVGLFTWLLEPFAWQRLRVKEQHCRDCGTCLKHAPCAALDRLVAGERGLLPDCYSCGLCLNSCPRHALHFDGRRPAVAPPARPRGVSGEA
jgi:polyferredoxin